MNTSLHVACCLIALTLGDVVTMAAQPDYRFAQDFSVEEVTHDATRREQFIDVFMRQEGRFHQDRIGYSALNGMTYDAQRISPMTGEVVGMMYWSAPFQEDTHLLLLSMAVAGNGLAQSFVDFRDPANARDKALAILEMKIATLERFAREYPGFGGFLPWFAHQNDGIGIEPAWNYTHCVKSHQNGGFVWALVLTDHLLSQAGEQKLAARYRAYWKQLAQRSVPMFFDPRIGKIRGAVSITERPDGGFEYGAYTDPHHQNEEHSQPDWENEWLDDPYYGELMTLFMTLFGAWEDTEHVETVWRNKTVEKAVYETSKGDRITVRKGEWYSAIEMEPLLYLPYMDVPLVNALFHSGEAARTMHAVENGLPGLYSMVNIPYGLTVKGAEELYAVGIPSLAKYNVVYTNVVAPYAAYAVILQDQPVGVAWLLNMLKGRKVQGPYGMSEGMTTDGRHTAMFLTWYAKATVMLALMQPELNTYMREALKKEGVYDEFIRYVTREYTATFGSIEELEGKECAIIQPIRSIPVDPAQNDFVPAAEATQLLGGMPFQGGDALAEHFKQLDNGNLSLNKARGFIFAGISAADLREKPYISFQYRTIEAGRFGFELKNRFGMPVNRIEEKDRYLGRIMVEVENTEDAWKTCSIDMRPLLQQEDATVITVVLVDPSVTIVFSADGTVISAELPEASVLLKQNNGVYSVGTNTVRSLVSPAVDRSL